MIFPHPTELKERFASHKTWVSSVVALFTPQVGPSYNTCCPLRCDPLFARFFFVAQCAETLATEATRLRLVNMGKLEHFWLLQKLSLIGKLSLEGGVMESPLMGSHTLLLESKWVNKGLNCAVKKWASMNAGFVSHLFGLILRNAKPRTVRACRMSYRSLSCKFSRLLAHGTLCIYPWPCPSKHPLYLASILTPSMTAKK